MTEREATMNSAGREPWIVGFLYRLTAIGVVALAILEPLWWLSALAVGLLTAWSAEWGTAERAVAVVGIVGAVVAFGMLVNRLAFSWAEGDWIERVWMVVAVLMVGVWIVWFADWDIMRRNVERVFSAWPIYWNTVVRIVLGAGVAIVFIYVGRLAGWGTVYFWRFLFWLITGEHLNSKRAFELNR